MAIHSFGYLQHSSGTAGPFRTERAPVRFKFDKSIQCYFCGRWRVARVLNGDLSIPFEGKRINLRLQTGDY